MTPSTVPCPTCKGRGKVPNTYGEGQHVNTASVQCPEQHCFDGFMSTDWTASIAKFVNECGYDRDSRSFRTYSPTGRDCYSDDLLQRLKRVRP